MTYVINAEGDIQKSLADIDVNDDIYITHCDNLTTLPNKIKSSGKVYICNNNNLTKLPSIVECYGLELHNLPMLENLPKVLKAKFWIDINGCPRLKYIPNNIDCDIYINRRVILKGTKFSIPLANIIYLLNMIEPSYIIENVDEQFIYNIMDNCI